MKKVKEKANDKNALYTVVIVICCVLALILGFYVGGSFNNTEGGNSSSNSANGEYAGDYGIRMTFVDKMGTTDNADYVLNLREDGTFKYNINNYENSTPSVGTYKVEGKKIILTEKVRYGSDACFYTDKLRTITVNIKDKDVLIVNDNFEVKLGELKQTDLEFFKNDNYKEDPYWRHYYVTKPVNGKQPIENTEKWTDCTGQE